MQSPFLSVCKEDKNEDEITLLSCLYCKNPSSSLSCPDVQSSSAVHFQGGGGKKSVQIFCACRFLPLTETVRHVMAVILNTMMVNKSKIN